MVEQRAVAVSTVPGRHPVPWSGGNGIHLEPQQTVTNIPGMTLRVGDSYTDMTAVELAALRDQIDRVLAAPYRLIVAGGDRVNATDDWPEIFEWLDEQHQHLESLGSRLQIVNGYTNRAQSMVTVWAYSRRVEHVAQRPVDYTLGCNAVMMLPDTAAAQISRVAREGAGRVPVLRAAPYRLWAAGAN